MCLGIVFARRIVPPLIIIIIIIINPTSLRTFARAFDVAATVHDTHPPRVVGGGANREKSHGTNGEGLRDAADT